MLRRITEHHPELLRDVYLRPQLDAQALTGLRLPQLSIGRHTNNDVVLTFHAIEGLLSRQHAVITYDGEQYVVVDQGSTNGTMVNTIRLMRGGRRTLRVGDIVSFGGPAYVRHHCTH
jgi:pSer/pThr/pTyr-binding forkhead associated (FHA) protein